MKRFASHPFVRLLRSPAALLAICGAWLVSAAAAQTHIEQIGTSLHHVSVIQVPEPVENVAIGTQLVHVEWHDRTVLVEPLQAGVDTNIVVFTPTHTYLYEIEPASEPGKMSYLVRESAPAPPPPPPTPAPDQIQQEHDRLYGSLLLTTLDVNSHDVVTCKHGVTIRVVQVSEDAHNYYVRLSATNYSNHTYRLENPTVRKIDPAFGADMAYSNVNHQISDTMFGQFRTYQQTPVDAHGSTLEMKDLPPDTFLNWVMALTKPATSPSMFRFAFPSDEGTPVDAIAIF